MEDRVGRLVVWKWPPFPSQSSRNLKMKQPRSSSCTSGASGWRSAPSRARPTGTSRSWTTGCAPRTSPARRPWRRSHARWHGYFGPGMFHTLKIGRFFKNDWRPLARLSKFQNAQTKSVTSYREHIFYPGENGFKEKMLQSSKRKDPKFTPPYQPYLIP